MLRVLAASLSLVVASVLVGCPGDPCPADGRGALTVEVTGLPDGVAPDLAVHGPSGHHVITATTTIHDLDSGEYSLMMEPVAQPGGRVRLAFAPAADPETVCVRNGQTATTRVTYAQIATSGKLWMGNTNGGVRGGSELFSVPRDALGATATVTVHSPTVTVSRANGLAFDGWGNLWVADGSRVLRFDAGEVAGASATAQVTISGAQIETARGLAFDGAGSLWVSLQTPKKLIRINASDLAENPIAAVTLTTTSTNGPTGMAFAPNGALFVALGEHFVRYDAGQLGQTGTPTPAATFVASDGAGGTLRGAEGLAFDADGDLWVSYATDGKVARFSAAQIAGASATLTPGVRLDATISGHGLAFDEEGGLWVAITNASSGGTIGRYAPSQLDASGSAPPEVVLTGAQINGAVWPAIFPPPAWSPLHPKL